MNTNMKQKNINFGIVALAALLFATHFSYGQKYQWTKMVTPDDQFVDPGHKITQGKGDNYFITTRMFNEIGLGSPPKRKKDPVPTLKAGSNYGLYIGKCNADGTSAWSKLIKTGGGGTQYSTLMTRIASLVEAPDGSIYITGNFEKSIDFGNGITLESRGINDMFVAKLDGEGKGVWAKRMGGVWKSNAEPGGHEIAVDPNGDVVVVGQISGWHDAAKAEDKAGIAYYQDEKLDITIMTPTLVVKLAPDGTKKWLKLSYGMPTLKFVRLDQQGNIYLGGNAMHIGGWDDIQVKVNGLTDIALAKLDGNGKAIWYKQFGYGEAPVKKGDFDTDNILAMSVAPSGVISIIGQMKSGGSIDDTPITGKGLMDMVLFMADFSPDGKMQQFQTLDPGKLGMLIGPLYKGQRDGGLYMYLNPKMNKGMTVGALKLKKAGVYKVSGSTCELVSEITGSELSGYLLISWDFISKNGSVVTVGNLTTPAAVATSKAVKKYWEKSFTYSKKNPKTGVVYSLYSK